MSSSYTKTIFALAAVAMALTACNRNQTQAPPAPAPQAPAAAPAPAPQAAPAPIPPATELPVNTVDSVMLSRPQDAPMAIIVRVAGTVPSAGWTNAKLAEEPDSGDASLKTYKFVATSPEMPDENRAQQPVEAEIRIDSVPAEVTTIRIVSAMNEISAPVAQ